MKIGIFISIIILLVVSLGISGCISFGDTDSTSSNVQSDDQQSTSSSSKSTSTKSSSSSSSNQNTEPHTATCDECYGSGICQSCGGTGARPILEVTGNDYSCIICGGNGICPACTGTGQMYTDQNG